MNEHFVGWGAKTKEKKRTTTLYLNLQCSHRKKKLCGDYKYTFIFTGTR